VEIIGKENYLRITKFYNIPEKLMAVGEEFFFAKNKTLFSPEDIPDGFYYVKEGRVKTCSYSPKNNENILSLVEKGGIFLETNPLFNIPCGYYFKTVEPSTLLFFKKKDILDLLKTDFEVTQFLLQSITCKFYTCTQVLDELLVHDSEWRICRLLLTFAANFGKETEGKTKLNIKISQQFISEMLGVTRGTTIKVINKLKELNLIEQTNGYYYIKDLQRLKNHLVEITT
jgi:CRP/FNR family transcriptional regulator